MRYYRFHMIKNLLVLGVCVSTNNHCLASQSDWPMTRASCVEVIKSAPFVVFKFSDDIHRISTTNNIHCICSLCGGVLINTTEKIIYTNPIIFSERTLQTDNQDHPTIEEFPYSTAQFWHNTRLGCYIQLSMPDFYNLRDRTCKDANTWTIPPNGKNLRRNWNSIYNLENNFCA